MKSNTDKKSLSNAKRLLTLPLLSPCVVALFLCTFHVCISLKIT